MEVKEKIEVLKSKRKELINFGCILNEDNLNDFKN